MTKNNDLGLEQKASAEFDKALRGLSNLITPLDRSAAQSDKPISEIESKSSFRDGLMDEILRDHPGLTREKLDLMMKESGF
jgi:hypothetical protein